MSRTQDRVNVLLFSLAAFLSVLALLGWQLGNSARTAPPRAEVLVRKIYKTTVIERVIGAHGGRSGTSVSQSVAGASGYPPAPVVTKTS